MSPSNAAFRSASAPVAVTAAVPSPPTVRFVVCASVSVPPVSTARATSSCALSTSATLSSVAVPAVNVSVASSAMFCGPGTRFWGASLPATTLIVTASISVSPTAVVVSSSLVTVSVAGPVTFSAGV